jgi:hypothetical protein
MLEFDNKLFFKINSPNCAGLNCPPMIEGAKNKILCTVQCAGQDCPPVTEGAKIKYNAGPDCPPKTERAQNGQAPPTGATKTKGNHRHCRWDIISSNNIIPNNSKPFIYFIFIFLLCLENVQCVSIYRINNNYKFCRSLVEVYLKVAMFIGTTTIIHLAVTKNFYQKLFYCQKVRLYLS